MEHVAQANDSSCIARCCCDRMHGLARFAGSGGQDTSSGFDDKLFSELRWRSIGPHRGGRSLAVTGVRGQPELFYFGSVDGGVWRTNDAGRTWNPIFDSQPVGSIGAIAVAPSDPAVIYVGTGESDMRSRHCLWQRDVQIHGRRQFLDAHWIEGLAADRAHPGRSRRSQQGFCRGARARLRAPTPSAACFVRRTEARRGSAFYFTMKIPAPSIWHSNPGITSTIYAALLQTRRPPWNVYPPSNGSGQRPVSFA